MFKKHLKMEMFECGFSLFLLELLQAKFRKKERMEHIEFAQFKTLPHTLKVSSTYSQWDQTPQLR